METTPPPTSGVAATVVDSPFCTEGGAPAAAAFSLTDGSRTWLSCSPEAAWRELAGAGAGRVYVAVTYDGRAPVLVALDAASGVEAWRHPMEQARSSIRPGRVQGPFAGGDIVVIPEGAASPADPVTPIVGLDAATGEERWRIALDGQVVAHTPTMVLVSTGASILGLDRATGAMTWQTAEAVYLNDETPPAVLAELVVLATTDGGLVALDAVAGTTRWTGSELRDLCAAGSTVGGFLPEDFPGNQQYVALDAATGAERWTQPASRSETGRCAISDEAVYLFDRPGADGQRGVTAHDLLTGAMRWQLVPFIGQPENAGDGVLIGQWEGTLVALDAADADTRWLLQEPLGTPWMESARVVGAIVVVSVNSLGWGD